GSYASCYAKITASQFNNAGNVTAISYAGGFIGYGSATAISTITGSTSSATIEGEYMIGGLAGQLATVKLVECSNEETVIKATGYKIDGTSYYAYVGGYVGSGYAFENCHNTVAINYTERGIYVGGIAGYANGEFSGCTNTAAITAENANYVGGIVGYVSLSYDVTLTSLTNSGEVTGKDYVGGISGSINFYTTVKGGTGSTFTYTLTLSKMTNNGEVRGENQVGGIIGRTTADGKNNGSYASCYAKITASQFNNAGNVTAISYVGGLIGYGSATTASNITGSVSSGEITATENMVGGLAGQLVNIKLTDCSNENSVVINTGYKIENTTYYAYVGGYVGSGYAFENCHNTVAIN
ncbi:MAG: hypothetical protein K2L72_05030, partial [Clostridia bacterium]|nr:hypothetical protein [Clostridia bacterium]